MKGMKVVTMPNEYAYLTTEDNPYDPFADFDKWFLFDIVGGYNSCGYLARIAKTSEQLTEQENLALIDNAIDQIILNDPTGFYKKVVKNID